MPVDFESALNELIAYIEHNKEKGIEVLSEQDYYHSEIWKYRIPYQADSVNLLHNVSGIPTSVIHQFLNLNILRYMVKGLPTDIYLDITITKKSFAIWFGNDLYRHSIFRVFGSDSNGFKITYTYRNENIDDKFSYEDGYQRILKDINSCINPTVVNSLNFLKFERKTLHEIIQNKIEPYGIKYLSREDFCEKYNQPKQYFYDQHNKNYNNYDFEITTEIFDNFIKDSFSQKTYKKILHLMNLLRFRAYVKGEDIKDIVKVMFPMYSSKYADYNTIFYFEFLSTTISLLDSGEFVYQDDMKDEPVFLCDQDINIIYDYFLNDLKDIIAIISKSSDERLSIKDIEIHRMMIY